MDKITYKKEDYSETKWYQLLLKREFIDLNQLPYNDPLKCVEIHENKKFIKKRRKLHTLNPTEFIVSK